MKKVLLAVGALFLILVLAVGGYAAYLVRSISTPEFKKAVLERAKATVGADVQVKDMDISILSGVTLKGVTIANPAPFPGNLMNADAFVLRYRLQPLLSGRLEVERLSLEKPVITLAMDAKGGYNYEKLGGGAAAGPAAKPNPAAGPSVAAPIALILKKLAVENAGIVMQDQTKATLMKVDDIDFDSAFTVAGGVAQGSGKATIALVSLADMMFLRKVSAPLEMSKEAVKLAPIRAKLAGGDVTGDVRVNLKDGFRYTANLDVKGAQVKTLLEESKSTSRAVSGTLVAKATFEGTGGMPTLRGKGKAEIADCKVTNAKVLALLSTVLKIPELANPDFDQCLVEFQMTGSRVQTPVLSLKGKQLQLNGKGQMNLDTSAIDYDMSLALGQPLLNKITVHELRAAFKDRGDGFSTVDFKITGTTMAPQTDLTSKVGKAAATEAVKSGVGKLFGKKK